MKVQEVAKKISENGADGSIYETIRALKQRSFPEYPIADIFKEINIDKHDVMNPSLRPDKAVYKKVQKTKKPIVHPGLTQAANAPKPDESDMEFVRWEKVNRIPLAFQELICNKRVSFCLANPAKREYKGLKHDETDSDLAKDLKNLEYANERVMHDNKIPSHDREIARNVFTYTEVAEFIYTESGKIEVDRYGFDSKVRIKICHFSRENDERFYPIKDEKGNLICFSREYKVREQSKIVTYFESYTDEEIVKFKQVGGYKWEIVGEAIEHGLGKMPIVFGWQRYPEYRNASTAIARLETILSNHGEINDYHAAPKMLMTNAQNITGFGEKGSSSMLIQAKGEADLKYITWEHSTDSVKAEIDRLLEMIYTLTQTPNINFDNLKGMGQVSGISIKLMFMDAHLAVKDKEGVLLDFMQRRSSIVCAYLKKINPNFEKIVNRVEIINSLDPFMIADEKEKAEIAQIENGGQATKSQLTTVIEAGGDQAEYDKIIEEEGKRKVIDITEPTI